MALSKIDTTNMIEDVPQSKLDNNINFRNIIINGDMSIAQRGTSQASITSSGYYTVDRYLINLSSLGTWTMSQETDVPTGQGFSSSLKMDCTTADASPAADDQFAIEHRVEGQNLQYLKFGTANAESLTLSFWVKSNKTGTYVASLMLNDASPKLWYSTQYTISASNTWEKKTITYPGNTAQAFDNDNGSSLRIFFWLGAGSNRSGGSDYTAWTAEPGSAPYNLCPGQVNLADSTSNEWYITGVQLEAGQTASEFEFLPVDVNQNRCFRYFEKNPGGAYLQFFLRAQTNEASLCSQNIYFKQEMRTNPTFTFTSDNYTPNNVDPSNKFILVYGTTTSSGSTARINTYEADAEL